MGSKPQAVGRSTAMAGVGVGGARPGGKTAALPCAQLLPGSRALLGWGSLSWLRPGAVGKLWPGCKGWAMAVATSSTPAAFAFLKRCIVVVQSLSCFRPFATPWTAPCQASPVLHHLPEFAQTHVHRVSDAIQLSHPVVPFSSCP